MDDKERYKARISESWGQSNPQAFCRPSPNTRSQHYLGALKHRTIACRLSGIPVCEWRGSAILRSCLVALTGIKAHQPLNLCPDPLVSHPAVLTALSQIWIFQDFCMTKHRPSRTIVTPARVSHC